MIYNICAYYELYTVGGDYQMSEGKSVFKSINKQGTVKR